MNNQKYTPIVIGESHYNTLGLIRSFGEEGYKPILVLVCHNEKDKKSFVSKSKYIDKCIFVLELNLIEELNKLDLKNSIGIIFPAGDSIANIIDQSHTLNPHKFITPVFQGERGLFQKANDKENMRKTAEKFGFQTPQTWLISKRTPVTDHNIKFPAILKSIHSQDAPKSTEIFYDYTSLQREVDNLLFHSPEVQIQSYIKKEKEIIYLGYSHNNEVCIPCVMEKIREYPEGFGCTGLGKLSPEINKYLDIRKLIELIRSYQYNGLFSVEFIIHNNLPFFLEINFRNDGNGYFPGYGGVNLPVNLFKNYEGKSINTDQLICNSYIMMREYNDFKWFCSNKYPLSNWVKDILKANVFQYWNRKDWKPFYFFMTSHISNFLLAKLSLVNKFFKSKDI